MLIAALAASAALAACGSGTPATASSRSARSARSATADRASGLGYARCMRVHGVSRFPDPRANGGIDSHVPGLNLASPAARAAESACRRLLPVKRPPSRQPTAKSYARLLAWAKCMRQHGIAGLPDPKPDPVPGPSSQASTRFGTIMGDGGYWVGIPFDDNAHSPAFVRLSTHCGESPSGPT